MTYPPMPPTDIAGLEPPDETDLYWARRIAPLLDRLQREYPDLYAAAERQARLEAAGTTAIATDRESKQGRNAA
jgi:hypothetical protein